LRILFVEGSSGGVVGGSLTGLYHLIRGLDRARFVSCMALYEPKTIEAELRDIGVTVHRVSRRRLPKQHALLQVDGYQRAKQMRLVDRTLRAARQSLRFALEELPAALALARIVRREQSDVIHLGNGLRANFDGLIAARLTGRPVVCHVKGFEKYTTRERRAARAVDTVVCMTRAIHAYCLEHGVMGRRSRVI
jgi:hypothetical protein